ncbi:hypothetical protein [Amycolatopsis sp. La24]|uniref:hypothetical protein n=1 Tax=Amycolatopsis sp. La24 TaxID=3028304 RepID=UPI0023B1B0F8|nr:hypothetical protein [Amycolatopsis sp. La24]
MLRNAELIASVMHAPMSVMPHFESLSLLPLPGGCVPVEGGGVVGCGMQSSPEHGAVVVGPSEAQLSWPGKLHVVGGGTSVGTGGGVFGGGFGVVVVGVGRWHAGSGEPGVHGSLVGSGAGGGCCGAAGAAAALAASTAVRIATALSNNSAAVRLRRR